MGRSPCCSKEGMNKGAWTATEDKILIDYIKVHGEGKWRNIPNEAGLKRCRKSCRVRWMNYLRPDIKRGNISCDEEDLIIRLHKLLGNRWSLIAGRLPGRTDNEIKNYWNTHLSKRGQGKSERRPKSNHSKVEKKPITASCCKEVFVAILPISMDANLVQNVPAESESSDGSLIRLMSCNEEENYSLDFMVDYNAGEIISVSEILTSGFPKLNHDDDLGTSEMEQNLSGNDYNIQANLDSDFGSLVAFLESAQEWII